MSDFDFEDDDRPRRRKRSRQDDYDDEDDDDYAPRRRRGGVRKSRLAYILLGLFFGELGVHNFYAGRTGPGVAQLAIFLVSIPLMLILIGFITVFIRWSGRSLKLSSWIATATAYLWMDNGLIDAAEEPVCVRDLHKTTTILPAATRAATPLHRRSRRGRQGSAGVRSARKRF